MCSESNLCNVLLEELCGCNKTITVCMTSTYISRGHAKIQFANRNTVFSVDNLTARSYSYILWRCKIIAVSRQIFAFQNVGSTSRYKLFTQATVVEEAALVTASSATAASACVRYNIQYIFFKIATTGRKLSLIVVLSFYSLLNQMISLCGFRKIW